MNQLIGIGALIDRSWDHYRAHYKTLLKISVWLLLVAVINIVAILLYPIDATAATDTSVWEKIGIALLVLNNTVVAIVIGTWMINALIGAIKAQTGNVKLNLQKLNQASWKLFFPQILVRVYLLLVYIAAFLLPMLLFWFVTNVGSTFLPTSVLFLLLFVALLLFLPPVALMVYLAFSVFALVEDNMRGWAAIKESLARTKNRFWPVAFRLLLPKLLYFGIFFLLQFLLVIVIRIIAFGIFQSGDVLSAIRVEWIALTVSYAVLFVFLNPMLLITDHILYNNLKKS